MELDTPSSLFKTPGYSFLRFDRTTRLGGGSAFYIKEDVKSLPLNYDVRYPHETEVQCLQIFPNYVKPIIIILIYNPPRNENKAQFVQSLEALLYLVERDKLEYVILGDINIDLLKCNEETKMLANLELTFSIKQIITQPTRVTLTTKTLLDHIYVSNVNYIVQSGVFSLTTSNHRFTYCIRKTLN